MQSAPVTVILAAGQSTRMGVSKPLLKFDGITAVERIVSQHRSLGQKVAVVLGFNSAEIQRSVDLSDTQLFINPSPEDGPLSSLLCAIEFFKTSEFLLLHPVDHPLVKVSTLSALTGAYRRTRHCILVPTYHGKKGHPVLLPHRFLSELTHAPLAEGARWVVRKNRSAVNYVSVEDQGIVENIDTWERYVELTGFPSLVRK